MVFLNFEGILQISIMEQNHHNVLVTVGAIEANYISIRTLLESW